MLFGIDVSNYTAQPADADFAALCNSERIDGLIIAAEFPDTFAFWLGLAQRQRLARIEAYGFLYDGPGRPSYAAQAADYLRRITGTPIERLWLDCEQTPGIVPRQVGEQELWDALDVVNVGGYPAGIYTSRGYWLQIGNPQIGKYCPLWDASWQPAWGDLPRAYELAAPYGGWLRAACVQYLSGHESYGMNLDLDAWER